MEKEKTKKEEARSDKKEEREERKEDLMLEKAKEEIEIAKIVALYKLQKPEEEQLSGVFTKLFGDGADSNLLNMMMLQKVMSSSGARAAA